MKNAVLLALLLAGCQTTEDRLASDDRQCQSYGAKIGSPVYVQCRISVDQERNARETAAIEQINQNNREAAANLERTMIRPAVNCTGTINGNTTQTTCR